MSTDKKCNKRYFIYSLLLVCIVVFGIYYYYSCINFHGYKNDEITNKLINNSGATNTNKVINNNELNMQEKEKHAVKAQFYRWFQLYERDINDSRIENQLSLLTDDISITTTSGTMKGKEGYPERLKVYKGWKNSHEVSNIDIKKTSDSEYELTANVAYKNIMPDGNELNYQLQYNTKLIFDKVELPVFKEIVITQVGESDNQEFKDLYTQNRLKSLMYNWLYNMEKLDGNVEPLKEILVDDFVLNFSSGKIDSIEGLETWLQTTPTQLKSSVHQVENLEITALTDNTYKLVVDFVWTGVTKDGTEMKATTHHEWEVIDDVNEKFARIKTVNVTLK